MLSTFNNNSNIDKVNVLGIHIIMAKFVGKILLMLALIKGQRVLFRISGLFER